MTREHYAATAQQAVRETVDTFHLVVATAVGEIVAPCSYQKQEIGFRNPFRAAKGSPDELQTQLDSVVDTAANAGVDLGIDSPEALRKLLIQQGLGSDCSNVAYRALVRVHAALGLSSYGTTVFRSTRDVLVLHTSGKPSWQLTDAQGQPRPLSPGEDAELQSQELIGVDRISEIFNKDHPVFVTGSSHMADESASVAVDPDEALPGDLFVFNEASTGVVTHLALIDQAASYPNGATFLRFWHSWHSRDFSAGLRQDWVTFREGHPRYWSHSGLADKRRYSAYSVRRPRAMELLRASFEGMAGAPPEMSTGAQ